MSERFHDDNFIEAAKVYQSIKAPSDLRERVLADAASAPKTGERNVKSGSRGKIYKLASIAACLAVMAAAVPGWLSDGLEGLGVPAMIRMAGQDQDQPDMAAMRMAPPPETENQVQISDLLPVLNLDEETLAQADILLTEGENGIFTVEIICGEEITQIQVTRNGESGLWEVIETEN